MKSSSLMRWLEGKLTAGCCLALILTLWPMTVLAQAFYMVKDINTTQDVGSSNPTSFTQVGTKTFFVAYVPGEGYQLWKTEGTAAGTALVTETYFSSVSNMTSSGGKLFFIVGGGGGLISFTPNVGNLTSSTSSAELWTSDGTAAGTKMLKSVNYTGRVYVGGNPVLPTDVNGTLFFVSDNGSGGIALWKTDGTTAGTVMVKDVAGGGTPDQLLTPLLSPYSLTAFNGKLYFMSYAIATADGAHGWFLWKSDGTAEGTVAVMQTFQGVENCPASNLTSVGGTLFFTVCGDSLVQGRPVDSPISLWRSDGSSGAMAIGDIVPPGSTAIPQEFTDVNGTLFFRTIDPNNGYATRLWKSDGSETVVVTDLCSSSCDPSPSYLTNVNGALFYVNRGGLWKSDGTQAGTVQIASGIAPSDLVALNGVAYFAAFDEIKGRELWKSDGTTNGTGLVKDICPGVCNSLQPPRTVVPFSYSSTFSGNLSNFLGSPFPILFNSSIPQRALAVSNGKVFFMACEPVNACEPWTSDGTSGGTAILKNVVLNTASQISSPVDLNGTLLFSAFDGSSQSIWKSDGTDAGTTAVKAVSGLLQSSVAVNGGALFVILDPANGNSLWKTDGTSAGTMLVKTIKPATTNSGIAILRPLYLTSVNGTAFFAADDGAHGIELWKSDGTADGTMMVKDLNPGSGSSAPVSLTNMNGTLFFAAVDGTGSAALWKSDGTDAGTVMVAAFSAPPTEYCAGDPTICASAYIPSNLTRVGNTLFFTVRSALWKSDGNGTGTVALVPSSTSTLFANSLIDVNGTLFFWNSQQLWKSDGTDAGTVIVKDFTPTETGSGVISSFALYGSSPMVNVNGTLYFTQGGSLWKSDGTDAGTVMVKDVPASGLANVKGVLYFAGKDANGTELWKSDGTDAGTVMVADINPGVSGSWPTLLATSHGKLYFTANDGIHGTELWALNVTPTSVTVTSSKSPVIVGGSITLTATVQSTASGTLTGTVQFMDGTNLLGSGTASGGTATLATSSLTAGTHSITAVYSGDTNFANSTSAAIFEVVLAAAPDYTLAANPATATIRAGQSATFAITATADAYFNGTITFSCGTLPRGVTCSFSPTTLNPTSASPAVTTLTVSTTSQSAALILPATPASRGNGMAQWASLGGVGLFGCALVGRRRKAGAIGLAILALMLAVAMSGCGGGSGHQNPNATPVGTSTVQVAATATSGTTGGNTAAHQMVITINIQ